MGIGCLLNGTIFSLSSPSFSPHVLPSRLLCAGGVGARTARPHHGETQSPGRTRRPQSPLCDCAGRSPRQGTDSRFPTSLPIQLSREATMLASGFRRPLGFLSCAPNPRAKSAKSAKCLTQSCGERQDRRDPAEAPLPSSLSPLTSSLLLTPPASSASSPRRPRSRRAIRCRKGRGGREALKSRAGRESWQTVKCCRKGPTPRRRSRGPCRRRRRWRTSRTGAAGRT